MNCFLFCPCAMYSAVLILYLLLCTCGLQLPQAVSLAEVWNRTTAQVATPSRYDLQEWQLMQGVPHLQGKAEGALMAPEAKLPEPLGNEALLLPQRRTDVDMAAVSAVLSQRMLCHPNAPLEFQQNTIPHRGAHKDTREVNGSLIAMKRWRPSWPATLLACQSDRATR